MAAHHGLLSALKAEDPERAGRLRNRARASAERFRREFPEDPIGMALAQEDACGDEPCPALDPAAGTCDLYTSRPITCRTFGPAVRSSEGNALAVCELCYDGATDEEIAACAVTVPLETEETGETLVAFALCQAS